MARKVVKIKFRQLKQLFTHCDKIKLNISDFKRLLQNPIDYKSKFDQKWSKKINLSK